MCKEGREGACAFLSAGRVGPVRGVGVRCAERVGDQVSVASPASPGTRTTFALLPAPMHAEANVVCLG